MAKKEFGEGIIFKITNYIMWFCCGSVYFALCNIPLVLLLLAFPVSNTIVYYMIVFLCMLPVGPAITSLFGSMGKLAREKDVEITKEYFKAYRQGFKQSFFLGLLQVTITMVLLVDVRFFSQQSYGKVLVPLVYTIILIISIISLQAFSIISRFYLKTQDVIKLSVYYVIKKFKVTLLNMAAIVLGGLIMYELPLIGLFFVAAIIAYTIMLNEKAILGEIEENIKGLAGNSKVNKDEIVQ